jgi:cellulose biosynthesis protein BcsQ
MSSDNDIEEKVKKSIIHIDISNKFENGILGKLDLIANHATMSEKVEDLPIMTRNLGTIENTLDRVLSHVKSDYDFILIDLPPRTDVILRTAMMASDYFIISLNPQPFAKMGMPNILNPIKKYEHIYKQEKGKNFKILGGIVGFYEKGITVQDIIYEQMKNDILECTKDTSSLFNATIPKSTIIQESQQGDGAILFSQPSSKIVRNYFDLTLEILERVLINEMSEDN